MRYSEAICVKAQPLHTCFGVAAKLLCDKTVWRCADLRLRRLWHAIDHGQIKVFYDSEGTPIGYVTWATLDNATQSALRSNPLIDLPLEAWNEGHNLWVMDFVVLRRGEFRFMLSSLLDEAAASFDSVSFFRVRRNDPNPNSTTWWLR